MINPLESAWEIHCFLRDNDIPYAIIGGLAVQYWGEPRFTRDIDITVMAPDGDDGEIIDTLSAGFESRVADPRAFAKSTRMLLLKTGNGYEIDISLGLPGYEDEVIKRAVDFELAPDKKVRLCSAEDLIIHKAVAGRPRDLEDIDGIIARQTDKLDIVYIRDWLKEFALALDNPGLPNRFEEPWSLMNRGKKDK